MPTLTKVQTAGWVNQNWKTIQSVRKRRRDAVTNERNNQVTEWKEWASNRMMEWNKLKNAGAVLVCILGLTWTCTSAFAGQTKAQSASKQSSKNQVSKGQTTTSSKVAQFETLPPGTDEDFHSFVVEIQSDLKEKRFNQAEAKAAALPKAEVRFKIDFSNVPADSQYEFGEAIRMASKLWKVSLGDPYQVVEVKNGKADLIISFQNLLAKAPDSPNHLGAAFFLSNDSKQPRLELVIGLKRGFPAAPSTAVDIHNEVLAAFGKYYGLAMRPVPGMAMGRTDEPMLGSNTIQSIERIAARQNLKLANQLRLAAKQKQAGSISAPSLFIQDVKFDFGSHFQGDRVETQLVIANRGNSDLRLYSMGSCGCIAGDAPALLKPGQTSLLKGLYVTDELNGEVNHNILLFSNDPDRPVIKLPSKIVVKPRYEFVYPEAPNLVVGPNRTSFTYYLNILDPKPFKILEATMTVFDAKVEFQPFKGAVLDASKDNRRVDVNGYKITADLSKIRPELVIGRVNPFVALRIDRDRPSILRTQLFLQSKLIALPESLFMGSPTGPMTLQTVVSKPGSNFNILSVSSSSKSLTFESERTNIVGEYRIKIKYDGKALNHLIQTVIEVRTDDPETPLIQIPIQSNQNLGG